MARNFLLTIILTAAALILPGGPAFAGTREDVLANTARCGAITDDRMWLDCYYGAAQPMRSHLGLSPAPAFQTRLIPGYASPPLPTTSAGASDAVPQPPETPPQEHRSKGFLGSLFGGKTLINKVPLSDYRYDKNGILTVTLANGEVWRQLSGDDSFSKWNAPASHYIVTIKEGSLGSANLQAQGEAATYKVRRVR